MERKRFSQTILIKGDVWRCIGPHKQLNKIQDPSTEAETYKGTAGDGPVLNLRWGRPSLTSPLIFGKHFIGYYPKCSGVLVTYKSNYS